MNTFVAIATAAAAIGTYLSKSLMSFFGAINILKLSEYFFLGIPFHASRGSENRTIVRKELRERFSASVGEVPHDVRKVALPSRVDFRQVTLVNSLF
jgi:hypothetical protein